MDVRQFVFLVCQPSSALLSAERFWGMPKRGLAFLLANAMFWQPLWVQANGIVINAPGAGLEHAGNGVPIVNIAAPNASGLSHNQFRDYNVGSEGVILNNATGRTQATQLGGIILGNPNLGGRAASTILNEVNGGNPSQLRGYTEVAGQSARVIVANPYGISCNGCGFINTPRVTLTTGKPVFNNGQLDHYKVDGGSVFIDGAGLNATNVDSFEIITRSAKINAEIHANKLSIVAGRNDVDAQSLNAVARANDGSAKPELAIDSSALGGMYAGAIKLVATEAGVGVRLAGNLAASGGDIQIDANGNLSLAQATSTHAINIKAASLDAQGPVYAGSTLDVQTSGALSNQRSLAAGDRISLSSGGQLSNNGIIEAGANADNSRNARGDISLSAQNLRNTGTVVASRNLDARVSQTFDNSGGLMGSEGLLTASAANLVNRLGSLSSGGRLSFTSSGGIDNQGGKLISSQQLSLDASSILNQNGLISGWEGLSVTTDNLDNRNHGTLSSRNGDVAVNVSGDLLNSGAGALVSQQRLTVNAGSLDNSAGGILSSAGDQALTVQGLLNNTQGGLIDSGGALTLQAMALDNTFGAISAQRAASFTGAALDNSHGNLIGNAAVTLNLLGVLTNSNGKLASTGPLLLQHASQVNNQGGQLASQGLMTLLIGGLDNRNGGTVAANDHFILTASGTVQNSEDGLIYSQHGDLRLYAASLANSQGTLQSQGKMNLEVLGDIDNQNGRIIAQNGDLNLTAANVDNRGGVLSSLQATLTGFLSGWLKNGYDLLKHKGGNTQAEHLNLTAMGGIDNQGGRLAAQSGDAVINTAYLDNREGGLYAAHAVGVTGGALANSAGQIAAEQIDLSLAGALSNRQGIIESNNILTLNSASIDNQFGQLRALGTSGASRFLIGGLFDNRNGTLESANTDLHLAAGNFMNTGGTVLHVGSGSFDIATANVLNAGGSLVTRAGLTLNADSWTNTGIIQAGRLTLNVNNFAQSAAGQLLASDSLYATGVNWSNDGLIASDGDLYLGLSGAYSGTGRLTSRGDLNLLAGQLTLAESASIASGGDGLINVAGLLSNRGRLTSAGDLTVYAGNLNNHGTLGSGQDLTLTTNALLNDHGLIFSGWDIGLRVASLINSYASIYSLGDLDIDRDGKGGWATSIVNSSGLIQGDGSMSLAASTIQNIRALLTISDNGIYTAKIEQIPCVKGVNAGDCSGKQNRVWEITQRDKLEISAASAASSITAGGNLNINGGDLLNHSSTIATSGNFIATLNNLTNTGVETSDTETVRVFRTERARNGSGWSNAADDFTERYWFQSSGYDVNNLSGLVEAMSRFVGTTEFELSEFGRTTQLATGDQTYAAIIQAAGNVSISTQNNFENSVVRGGFDYVGSGPRTNTDAPDSNFSTRITLNQQLPPDLAQQQVNPLTMPGFELPVGQNGLFRLSGQGGSTTDNGPEGWSVRGAGVGSIVKVQGLPSSHGISNPHKYLIETNPALTDLKQFMGSDYLLGKLGYNPDDSAKRLGDGFYEQKLIQQAVVARTGQRFIDGLTSDEAMFRYLIDNAIASKDELNLSLGVTLTAEQVAALTHDIVWMETATVNGENVLVPVLYLANSNNRLAANGALIQGQDVSLIAGKELKNAGTLKASANLAALAGNNLVNSGLVNAGNRLDLLASNDLSNKAGGIIAGRDVSLTSISGDVINERTVTGYASGNGHNNQHRDFIDNAARIEAANDLTISAGRDVNNIGGVLQSGRDSHISAGRDVTIGSAEQVNSNEHGSNNRDLAISQNASTLDTGRDLSISAGRDLSAIASQIDAGRDIALDAGKNLTLASAADEEHSYSKTKKVEAQEDHVSQIGTRLNAGGSVVLTAGQDLTLISSKVSAGDEAYLVAGGDLSLLAAQDSHYSLYDKEKKGGWGSKETQRDEVTDIKNVGSDIKTGGGLTLVSGGDQLYQGAKLESGKDIILDSGGSITFEAVKDLHQESHEKSKGDLAWQSSSGKGNTDETLRQSELVAQGHLVIKAVDGLRIDLKHIDQKSVSQTIDAMVQADPNLAWLKAAEQRGDVDWQLVKEIHDAYDYSSSGLGAGAQLVIAIVMAAFVGPAALTALGGAGAVAAGGAAIATGAATTATVSVINNGGNLGAVFKDVTSSDALKGYAISGITAGMTAGYFNDWTGTTTDPVTDKISTNLGTWKGVGQFAASQGLQNGTSAALGKIMGQGGDLGDALQSTLFNTLAAASFNAVGDYTKDVFADGSVPKIFIHAMVGGLLAEVSGGDFKTGALAAGANEALVDQLNTWVDGDKNLLNMTSQLVGMLAAATQSGADAESLQTGAWVAQNATQYNFFDHLPPGMSEYGQAATSLAEYMQGQGATAEDITQAQLALAQGQGFEGVQPANEFVKAWGIFMAGELFGIGVGAAIGAKGSLSEIKLVDGFYQAEGAPFKFSEYYYNRLWSTGRGAPFIQADEVLKTATTVTPDRMSGFYRYTNSSMEMVYNPATKEIWHLQPLR